MQLSTRRILRSTFSPWREWPGCSSLRASNEHCFIVRVLRARRTPGCSLFPSFRSRSCLPFKGGLDWSLTAPILLFDRVFFTSLFLYGRASVVVPLRLSSEHILIVRAPGAVGHTGFPNLSFSLLGGGLVESPTARLQRGPSDSLYLERPPFHRGGSASRKGTWPLLPPIFARLLLLLSRAAWIGP